MQIGEEKVVRAITENSKEDNQGYSHAEKDKIERERVQACKIKANCQRNIRLMMMMIFPSSIYKDKDGK